MSRFHGPLIATWLLCVAPVRGGEWPQWRGPQRNGQTAAGVTLPADVTVRESWQTNVGTGFSSLAIAGGRVYTLGNRDNRDILWCLDVRSGEPLWKHEYAAPLDPNLFEGGPTATPAAAEGRVYSISRRGDVFCLDTGTGAVQWSFSIVKALHFNVPTWGFAGSPLVVGERIIVNAGSSGLCLHAKTGEILWSSDNSDDAGYSSPLLVETGGTRLILLLSAKSLNAVELESGRLHWSLPWITRYGINAADPVLVDERHLLISSGYGKGTALIRFDAEQAEQLWRKRDLRNQMAPGLLLEGHLYAVDGDDGGDNELVCLEARTGEVKWRSGGIGSATLIAVGGRICLLTQSGELVIVRPSPDMFDVMARRQIGRGKHWTPPAWADAAFFVRNASGDVTRITVDELRTP